IVACERAPGESRVLVEPRSGGRMERRASGASIGFRDRSGSEWTRRLSDDKLRAMTRRDALRLLPISLRLPMFAQNNGPKPLKVDIPGTTLNRILARVKSARLPDRLDAPDWRHGANWDYMKSLTEYWTSRFDWRKAEVNLNRYPQFVARVD